MTKTNGWVTSSFVYRGPTSGATLRRKDSAPFNVMLHDGATIELPAYHPYVKRLLAQGFITPAEPAAPSTPVVQETESTATSSSSSRKNSTKETTS